MQVAVQREYVSTVANIALASVDLSLRFSLALVVKTGGYRKRYGREIGRA